MLIYTVLHHCCSTCVVMHTLAVQEVEPDETATKDKTTVLFLDLKTAQTSLDNGNLRDQGLFPSQLLVA